MKSFRIHRSDGDEQSFGNSKALFTGVCIGIALWCVGAFGVGKAWPSRVEAEFCVALTLGGFLAALLNHRFFLQATVAVLGGLFFGTFIKSMYGLFDIYTIFYAIPFVFLGSVLGLAMAWLIHKGSCSHRPFLS